MRVRRTTSGPCLGERAAAVADGELGQRARDAALAHLVHCDSCRDEVAGQRRLKARLGDLTDLRPPAGLLERLSAIGGLGPLDDLPEQPLVVQDWAANRRHRVRLHGHRPQGRRGVRYAVAGGASVLALGVSAFALGGGGQGAPTVVPAVDSFTVEHASTADEVPVGGVPQTVSLRRVLVGAQR